MARSCGIRLGPRRYELVVLDGGLKKHKIIAYSAGDFPLDDSEGRPVALDVLKEALKKHRVPRENVFLSIDTGNAAFRHVNLPFGDSAKIAQVVKFEVEGQLPQWNIDDVIIDFHVLRSSQESSELMVTGVPKAQVGAAIDLLERAGVEPLDAELETSAMVNAAVSANLCPPDQAVLLMHVGEYSTSVVMVDAGAVRDMRVIHLGGLSHEVVHTPAAEAPSSDSTEGGEAAPAPQAADPVEIGRRIDQAIKRLKRELGRTVSAASTEMPLAAIYVCGIDLPGLVGSKVLDLEISALNCFEADGGQPAEGFSALVVAYGAALRGLGTLAYPSSLRREELRYSGAMERIEFPLAVTALLLCFLLGVMFILQHKEKDALELKAWYWGLTAVNYLAGEPAKGIEGNLPLGAIPKPLSEYLLRVKGEQGDAARAPQECLQFISGELLAAITGLRGELGQDGAIRQPQSAFVALCLVLDVLKKNEDRWRPSLRQLRADFEAASAKEPDRVIVQLSVVFFADNSTTASTHLNEYEDELRRNPWVRLVEHGSTETVAGDTGINVAGLKIEVDVDKYFELSRKLAQEGEAQ